MGSRSDHNNAMEEARKTQEELDRKVFYLKNLSELTSELSHIIQTDELLKNFVLMTMGTLGIREAFVLLYDREDSAVRTAVRGVEVSGKPDARTVEKLLYKCLDSLKDKSLTPMSVTEIMHPRLLDETGLGIEAESGLLFVIDRTLMGVAGFGATLSGMPLSIEEKELLFALTSSFTVFLKNARSFETIQALNEDLVQRNEELTQTIAELRAARYRIALLEKAKLQIRSLVQREMDRLGRANPLDFIIIILLAGLMGALFNFTNPQGISLLPEFLKRPLSPRVEAKEARDLMDAGRAILVDARPREFYEQKHVKGAINLPAPLFDIVYMMKLSRLDPEMGIILYGRSISRLYDDEVAYRLKQRDHENVRVLAGGLHAWEMAGFQVE